MAKTILAVVAALCAIAAVAANPAPRFVREAPLLQLDDAELQALSVAHPDLHFQLPNATEILQAIEGLIVAVEDKIANVTGEVEKTVENVLHDIGNAAQEAASIWNQTVVELAEKAAQAGVDVRDCIEAEQQPMNDIVEDLKTNASLCVGSKIQEVLDAVEKVQSVGPEVRELYDAAKAKAVECSQKGNILAIGVCVAGNLPIYEVEAVRLVAKAGWWSTVVVGRAAAVGPMATLCISGATAGSAAAATALADQTATCIKDKLSNN